ncbi:MAG: GAF domain-containing protein [Candidatus Rokubacteria bacterium]|nr:GAF domain-containing protein [Candidatus Rokubacteria bacterium]
MIRPVPHAAHPGTEGAHPGTEGDETRRLRGALRDLVALTALPALWVGRTPDQILSSLLEVVVGLLGADLAYARVAGESGGVALEAAHGDGVVGVDAAVVARALGERLAVLEPDVVRGVRHPIEPGTITLVTTPFGVAGRHGLLAVGAGREGFPSETERLTLEVAANQAVIAIQAAMVAAETRRQAEELRESERMRLTLLGNLPGAAYRSMAGPGWPVQYLSEAVTELTGYPPEDFLGPAPRVRMGELLHPDDRAGVWQRIKQAVAEHRPYENVYRLRRAGGDEKWLWDRGQGVYAPDGSLLALEGFVTDITARKRMEDQLREQTETIETVNQVGRMLSAELDLRTLVQGVTDAATRLTRAAFGAFFYNLTSERGESYTLYTLSGVPREAFERFPMPRNTPLFGPTFRGERPVRIDDVTRDPRHGQNPPYHGMPPGHLPVRSYLAVPVVSRTGEVLGGLFFGHPSAGVFTEREERITVALAAQAAVAMDNARLYEKEQRARAEAETANRTKDEFLATLSHELRTPLNAVLGWTVMLRGGTLQEPTRDRALEAIERNARMQAQLIEDLLDISRIVTGKLRIEARPVDLAAVAEAALDAVRPAADARRIELVVHCDHHAGPVTGDPGRLQQVVWNLLSNAVKFTPEGGRIELRVARAGDHAQVIVRDNGIGIAPDVLPYVFDRFRQADGSITRQHGGLGLGLAIVRHLVELHGGTVDVTSDGPGEGTTFLVILPRDRAAMPVEPPGVAPAAGTSDGPPCLDGLRVLIVEDAVDGRDLLSAMLVSRGADVRVASSAADAFATVSSWPPDVIVCDLEMPGEDGYSLLRRVREVDAERGRTTPAIAVTPYGGVEDRRRTLAAGFRLHLSKPLDPTELTLAVASVAGRL